MRKLHRNEIFEDGKYYIEYTNDFDSLTIALFTVSWDKESSIKSMMDSGYITIIWSYTILKHFLKGGLDYNEFIPRNTDKNCESTDLYKTTRSTILGYLSDEYNEYWEVSEDEYLLANICQL
jgi:hypothetical protein